VNLHDINENFWKILNQFEPYGPNNSKPIFVSNNLKVIGSPSKVGKDHLKLRVAQNGVLPVSQAFDAIGFNLGNHYEAIMDTRAQGTSFSMAYTIDENTWNGRTTLQMQVKDIKLTS
jgi:single-stranded-DNA-specific exonuclease